MRNSLVILVLCLCSLTNAVPLGLKKNMAIVQEQEDPMLMMATDEETGPEMMISRLNLPSNATSIRADITDGFSCDNKTYGYYADVENECQIFHVCLPVTYADGKENTFRWSFICPEETVFSQEYFTCMRSEDMSIDCEESFKYYELNRNFGMIEPEEIPVDEDEDELNMEEMSRQPSLSDEQVNKQTVEASPVKKQTSKVQNSNRKKTQANRVAIEAQRKKVQPLRKLPKPAVVATTAKPVVEESPIIEQEVEKTTIKYQRFTKRPIIPIVVEEPKPEEPKLEESKPEKEVIRQDLFAQKRKRPQIYFPTRFDASPKPEAEPKPMPFLKSDILVQKPAQPVVQNEAESQAQASEIAEVSIKPQVVSKTPVPAEKVDIVPIPNKEPASVYIPVKDEIPAEEEAPLKEETQPKIKSKIDVLPQNVPSRVEVVEIPIQKIDESVIAEGSDVLAEEPKPAVNIVEQIKAQEGEIPAEDVFLKKIVAQSEKLAESEKPSQDEEKTPSDSILEPGIVTLNEPEQSLQNLKSAEVPKPLEQEKIKASILEPQRSEETSSSNVIPEKILGEKKVETPTSAIEPEKLLADVKPKETLNVDLPVEDKKQLENQIILKNDAPATAPEISEPLSEKPNDLPEEPKVEITEPQKLETQPEKIISIETPSSEPQIILKSEIDDAQPAEPILKGVSASDDTPAASPDVDQISNPKLDSQSEVEVPAAESVQKLEQSAEFEKSASNEETAKIEEITPDVKVETPIESQSAESPIDAVKEINPEIPQSSEVQAERASEVVAEETNHEVQANSEKEIEQSANDNEEAQSLILDFISSLVNSENSNFEDQSAIVKEMSSDSLPEASIAEPAVAEAEHEPAAELEIIQTQDDQTNPLYIPMMPSNQQMYQIPVQVIESPESEQESAVQTPVVGEPKLPLSVDDVVELVKESLDTPAKKESLVQEPSKDDSNTPSESEEVKPIYHRYIELGSNLLKSEALTASDDEPVIIPAAKEELTSEKEEKSEELPKTSEKLSEPETLASKPDSQSQTQATETGKLKEDEKTDSELTNQSPKEARSLNRFRMDPRKRRFLFRSDAS